MKQTAVLQNSMQDLETQNDVLRKTIESYESRFSELQVQLEKIHFEVNYNLENHNARNDVFRSTEWQSHQRNRQSQVRHFRQE